MLNISKMYRTFTKSSSTSRLTNFIANSSRRFSSMWNISSWWRQALNQQIRIAGALSNIRAIKCIEPRFPVYTSIDEMMADLTSFYPREKAKQIYDNYMLDLALVAESYKNADMEPGYVDSPSKSVCEVDFYPPGRILNSTWKEVHANAIRIGLVLPHQTFLIHCMDRWKYHRLSLNLSHRPCRPNNDFPEDDFYFLTYEELPSRLTRNSPLTDYIGWIRTVGELIEFVAPNRNLIVRRSIQIEETTGDIIELTMWGDMARNFDVKTYCSLVKPVIIAVTSCRVTQYKKDIGLSSTCASRYFFNPDILEAHAYEMCKAWYSPPLAIQQQRYHDKEREKTRNLFPLATLLTQNPKAYKYVRFTCKGKVVDFCHTKEWYYHACRSCNKKLLFRLDAFECREHGPQQITNFRYSFKGTISDGSAEASFTFLTPAADILTGIECKELVEQSDRNPYVIPQAIKSIKGKEHIFQFHYNLHHPKGSDIVDFTVDGILDDSVVDKSQSEQPGLVAIKEN